MSKFEVGDFIVAQEGGGPVDFGVVLKVTAIRSQFCDESTHSNMLSVRFPTGEFVSFADECRHYEDWLKDHGV